MARYDVSRFEAVSFNPTMVRLLQCNKQFKETPLPRFNPTMVRLLRN